MKWEKNRILTIWSMHLLAAGVLALAAVADVVLDCYLWTNSMLIRLCLIRMVNIVVEAFVVQILHCQPFYLLQPNVSWIYLS